MILEAVAVFLALWLVSFKLRRRRMHQLAKRLPGKEGLPAVGNLYDFAGSTEDIMTTVQTASYSAMKFGGLTRVWLGYILFIVMVDPVDIEFVLKTCLEKDDVHRFLNDIVGDGIVYAPVRVWRRRRKVIVPAFSPKILDGFLEVFIEQSEALVGNVEKQSKAGVFDAWPHLSSYTLKSVSETVMGIKLGGKNNTDKTFLNALNEGLHLVSERIFHVWLHLDWVYKYTSHFKRLTKDIDVLFTFTDNVIKCKRDELTVELSSRSKIDHEDGCDLRKRRTFLDLMITQSAKEKAYSNLELREEVLSLTIAGTDTSAVAMAFTLLLLGKHEDVQDKVYQELLDIYGNSDRLFEKEDASKMVYLERVVKESLRLYPPVPIIVRKVEKEVTLRGSGFLVTADTSSVAGSEILRCIKAASGHVLPRGSGVPISIWGVHRNPKYWGEDAEVFDPDRFSPERYQLAHPCAFMPFSSGPRNCLGYQYAMISIKISISAMLRRYRVMVSEENRNPDPIRVKFDIMMKASDGYNILVEPRRKG